MKIRALVILLFLVFSIQPFAFKKAADPLRSAFGYAKAERQATPTSIEELRSLVKGCFAQGQKISVAGAQKSQGGQVIGNGALQIDMTKLRAITHFDKQNKLITVQAGAPWHDVQKYIDIHGLAIKAMQSYNTFSVGGSLSVNAHGQDIRNCSISSSIHSCMILQANGKLETISKYDNPELFSLVIGGYGLFGIIVEITLELVENNMLKKQVHLMPTWEYITYFQQHIKHNKDIELHSARLSIDPQSLFDNALVINYVKDQAANQVFAEQSSKQLGINRFAFKLLRNFDWIKHTRFFLEKNFFEKNELISRNNAMGSSLDSLTNNSGTTTDILQEYFLPYDKLLDFLTYLKQLTKVHSINLLNATLRYVKPTPEVMLSYANRECCAIVLYINVENTKKSLKHTQVWSQLLINHALELGGTYYLPYHLFATKEQLIKAYANFETFLALKKKYDPTELFVNQLYIRYG